jgi:hypothetical protein
VECEDRHKMGKRYKKGNKGKHKKKTSTQKYMQRERELNKLINKFRIKVLNLNENNINDYYECNRLRLKIKELIALQSKTMYSQSRKRRYVYYDQVMNFKGLYVTWKKLTLPLFLKTKYDFPDHIIPMLCVYYRDVKRGGIVNYNIF